MRDKQFYVNAIKMDLYRVVVAVGDTSKEIPVNSVKEFMQHAINDFKKINLDKRESGLLAKLQSLFEVFVNNKVKDRLHWAEDILTIRCRL